jgi:hypothetical protein
VNAYINQASQAGVTTESDSWPEQLATRLFALPARWGWQAAPELEAAPSIAPAGQRPEWAEPPSPDTSPLYAARAKATSRLIRRIAFAVVAGVAFAAYRLAIEQKVQQQSNATQRVYWVVLGVAAVLIALGIIRGLAAVRRAARAIRNFEQPYRALRASERQRHEQALRDWETAVRQHQDETAAAARLAAQRAEGPLWFPVQPTSEPARVDVFGGDPRRNGWASLLVTLGVSVLAAGHRVTLLDLTGQDVGGGLARVVRAHGMPASRTDLSEGSDVNLLDGVPDREVAACLGYVLTGRAENGGDVRPERSLATEVFQRVLASLEGAPTFGRLAAGTRVLRQGAAEGMLTETEVSRLAAHIGDLDQTEWTSRQLRLLASQLDVLNAIAPAPWPGRQLWTPAAVTVITTPGGREDRKELIDRLLIRVCQAAMTGHSRLGEFLVVAGGDHLGARELAVLSDCALRAAVRLVLMIDQPQGDLEKTAGTGGAVCVMKMYNHRDAAIAAEFIGKGHKFVISQVTRQVGKTFTDGGGDSFAANTGHSDSVNARRVGKSTSVSDSRGHAWTGTRNWSSADNMSSATTSARVHEFIVDPQEILAMPETAFILVDNSGHGRRVAMADANPGISLLPRVAETAG